MGVKSFPIIVPSYARCEHVRKMLTNINVSKCVKLYLQFKKERKGVNEEFKNQIRLIITLNSEINRLEARSFLKKNYTLDDLQYLSADELIGIVRDFANNTMTVGEIEDYLKYRKAE